MTCHWETLPTHAHSQGSSHICVCTHAHTRTHSHTITTNVTWIVLFNSHDNSRSQRTILNFQLLENEAEAWRGGVSSEGWIPTRADWPQDPHAPNQGTGGQPTCDGHNEPDAVRATATQPCSRWTPVSAPWSVQWPQPHPASPGHTAPQNHAHHFWAHTSSPLHTHCACHHCPLSRRLNLAGTAEAQSSCDPILSSWALLAPFSFRDHRKPSRRPSTHRQQLLLCSSSRQPPGCALPSPGNLASLPPAPPPRQLLPMAPQPGPQLSSLLSAIRTRSLSLDVP